MLVYALSLLLFSFPFQPLVSRSSGVGAAVAAAADVSPPKTLNLTTIAVNAQKESVLECWQLANPLVESTTPGTAGAVAAQLGQTNLTSYSLIPPDFDGGIHNAPAVQYVAFTSGLAVISLPNSSATATIHGGRNGLIIAADIKAASTYGHITKYPGNTDTVVLQIPLADNAVPEHTVLHEGPCRKSEEDNRVT